MAAVALYNITKAMEAGGASAVSGALKRGSNLKLHGQRAALQYRHLKIVIDCRGEMHGDSEACGRYAPVDGWKLKQSTLEMFDGEARLSS